METHKKHKNRYHSCLLLFINNVALKNSNRNYRKSFWIFWVLEKLQWLCFNSILIYYEITYDTVMKNSGACWRWGWRTPSKVLICWKSGKHPWKSAWKWRPTLFYFKTWRPRFAENHMKTFSGGHTKKGIHDPRGREFVGKSCAKNFSWSLGKFGQKSFATPKISLLLNLWWKGTSAPVAPVLKGQRGKCPRHASIFLRPCVY